VNVNDNILAADVWGDEYRVVREAMDWAEARVVRETDPKTTARSADELRQAAGSTVCPEGIGGLAALRVFVDVLEPATRAQDDPMNLAYVPSAPTRASVAFDFVTSAANVFGGVWETGAGVIFAENEALAWLIELLGWPRTAATCRRWSPRGKRHWPDGGAVPLTAGSLRARERCTPQFARPPRFLT